MVNKTLQIKDLVLSENLDILLLTETWLSSDIEVNHCFNRSLPSDYCHYHKMRVGKRGGGV